MHIKCFWSLIIALIFLYPNQAGAQEEPIGKIISIMGTAEYLPGTGPIPVAELKLGKVQPIAFQSWKKVVPRQPVFATDEFRTASRSRLRILFNDNSLLALGPGSQLKVSYYLHRPKAKLRQGELNLVRGVSMYIINNSQIHKRSKFRMITPTAVVTSRGTQGYLKVSSTQTIVANDAGSIVVANIDPAVGGNAEVGANMKTIVAVGQRPSKPVAVSQAQLDEVRRFVLGWVFFSRLIEKAPEDSLTEEAPEEDETEETEEEETTEETTTEEETAEETTTEEETAEETTTEETTAEETTTTSDTTTTDTITTIDTGSGDSLLGDFTSTEGIDTGTFDVTTEEYYMFDDTSADTCLAG